MPYLLIILLLSLPLIVKAQETATIKLSGEVLNQEDQTPVPYAYIRVRNKPIGISANSEGKFSLILDNSLENESLVFSSIGYRSEVVNIQEVLKNNTVLLRETAIVLSEVVISDPEAIILSAIKNFTNNYPKDPFQLNGFYRTTYKENDMYVRLLEASVGIADKGFGTPNGYKVNVEQARQSNDYREFKWKQGGNYLFDYLKKDNIRNQRFFLNKKSMKDYSYSLEELTEFDGKETFHIKVKLKDTTSVNYAADVYISSKDYAIIQIIDSTSIKQPRRYQVADNLQIEFTGGITQTKYVNTDGKFYLSYSSAIARHNAIDNNGNPRGTLDLEEELLVLDVMTGKTKQKENVKKQGDIYQEEYPYNPLYWEEFNLPVDTQLYKRVKQDLSRREDLYKQFESNGISN